jgi:threonine synthase
VHDNVNTLQAEPVQRCASCGTETSLLSAATVCPLCGGLLDIVRGSPAAGAAHLISTFNSRVSLSGPSAGVDARSGVWRYRELLFPVRDDQIISFPEGNTPLLTRRKVAAWAGASGLMLKHEGMNPSGSFKDRGMCAAITQAKRVNATAVACASTGNTSSSLAAYAGIAELPAIVLVPSGHVAAGKLAQTIAYGARTLMVRGDFDDCLRLAREASEKLGVYLVNSLNPFRVEGQKTIVLEMLQQLDWQAPDWIALPAGNLGNAAAFGKAIRESLALGLIDKVPRVLLVQASGAAPFARSFREGFAQRHRVRASTVASAIRIGDPASYDRAVITIRETNGFVVDVSDDEIIEGKGVLDANGVGCEPASAASVAGVRRLVKEGIISPGASVVAVLTGHLLKDAGVEEGSNAGHHNAPRGSRSIEIEATLQAVEQVLANGAG